VITRNKAFAGEGIHVAESLEAALSLADRIAREKGAGEIVIAGGATIYAEAMPIADRLLVTEIDLDAEGDVRFPAIDREQWHVISRQHHPRGEGDDAAFTIVMWERPK
jgi:dihydrofolate reductase